MIESFADREAEKIFRGEVSRKLPRNIQESAREKLAVLDAMARVEDLWAFPALRAEKLSGDRKASGACASTSNGAYAFAGPPTKSSSPLLKSPITID